MAKLIYLTLMSLDGYIEDEEGKFDWAEPDEEVHAFVNELARPVGTYFYGRRMYEVMTAWETIADQPSSHPGLRGDLARGRQGRLFEDAGGGLDCEDADRARLRPGSGPAAEGDSGA